VVESKVLGKTSNHERKAIDMRRRNTDLQCPCQRESYAAVRRGEPGLVRRTELFQRYLRRMGLIEMTRRAAADPESTPHTSVADPGYYVSVRESPRQEMRGGGSVGSVRQCCAQLQRNLLFRSFKAVIASMSV
jgi:hypothetical protein